jgi:hypothetical protein
MYHCSTVLSLLTHLTFSVLLLFDIHVHCFPVVSLLVTDLCKLNLALVFLKHTSFQLSHLCYSCFPFHFFAFSNSFLFLLYTECFPICYTLFVSCLIILSTYTLSLYTSTISTYLSLSSLSVLY